MPRTSVTLTTEWELIIRPAEGEKWPVMPVTGSRRGKNWRPHVIRVVLRSGMSLPVEFAVRGVVLRKNGSESGCPNKQEFDSWLPAPPDWIGELVRAVRARLNLTEEALRRP